MWGDSFLVGKRGKKKKIMTSKEIRHYVRGVRCYEKIIKVEQDKQDEKGEGWFAILVHYFLMFLWILRERGRG